MKRILLSLATSALLLAAPSVGKGADVSVDFFYNNLSGGSWVEVGDYGYCWQPDVAVSNTSWRPYADGYWAYTDLGWTWVSYEDFGWATYHYGRWAMISDYGWVWVPGRDADLEWGPAWVSWRTGGDYIGWAPLPPETITVVESRPLTGHIDVEFNIGPVCYNFVEVRYIGEPVLRERIIAPTQNITYIQQTVNVTNITYKNKTVYNYGPDVNVVNRMAARPIQRLRLEREQNVDVSTAARSGGLTKVQGDKLVVAAPMHVSKSARQVAPPAVKTKIQAAKIDRGWAGVGDEKAQAEFKQRLRSQDLKNVPPPTGGAAGAAGQANVNAGASPGADTTMQQGQGNNRGRGGQQAGTQTATGSSPAPMTSPAASAGPSVGAGSEAVAGRGQGQGQGRRNRQGQPMDQNATTGGTSPAEAASGQATGAGTGFGEEGQGRGRGRQGRQGQQFPTAPPTGPGTEANTGSGDQSQSATGEGRHNRRNQNEQTNAPGQGAGQEGPAQGQGRHLQRQPSETVPADQQGQGGGARRQREGQGQSQGQGQERREGKKGKGEASPSVPPQ